MNAAIKLLKWGISSEPLSADDPLLAIAERERDEIERAIAILAAAQPLGDKAVEVLEAGPQLQKDLDWERAQVAAWKAASFAEAKLKDGFKSELATWRPLIEAAGKVDRERAVLWMSKAKVDPKGLTEDETRTLLTVNCNPYLEIYTLVEALPAKKGR